MLIIKHLSEMIQAEIQDAEKYAKHAVSYQDKDPELAAVFFRLANEELVHMDLLHDQVVRIINEYKASGNNPPEGMLMIWDYLHGELVRDVNEIREIMSFYRS